jgi:hypothetical protein
MTLLYEFSYRKANFITGVEVARSLIEEHAHMLRAFKRGVLTRVHVNKKEYKANTCK